MARITSKTNWTASDRPLAPDFSRIESNNEQAFDEIDAEQSARIAGDSVLQTNINAVEAQLVKIKTIEKNISSFQGTRTEDITGFGFTPTAFWEFEESVGAYRSATLISYQFISNGIRLTFSTTSSVNRIRVTCAGA